MRRRALLAILSLAALAACGSAQDGALVTLGRGLAAGAAARGGDAGDAAVERQLTREALDAATQPLLLAELPSREARATLVIAGQNRSHVTWFAADGIGLTLKDGLLTGTRGLGGDLMTADVSGAEAALRAGAGSAVRVHRYLDGENRVVPIRFDCRYAGAGRKEIEIVGRRFATREVAETCVAGARSFENRYWFGLSDGFLWKSRQWVGPGAGPIDLTRLVR